jgi:hypothetical protein
MESSFFQREFLNVALALRDPDRLITVQSNRFCGFYAGHRGDSFQAIAGRIGASHLLLVTFTKWGHLYDVDRHSIPALSQPPQDGEVLEEVNDTEFLAFMHDRFSFSSAAVQVRRFCVSDTSPAEGGGDGLWIDSLPWAYTQYLHAPEGHSDEEHQSFQEFIQDFASRGASCLGWNTNEYYLESNGIEPGWNL